MKRFPQCDYEEFNWRDATDRVQYCQRLPLTHHKARVDFFAASRNKSRGSSRRPREKGPGEANMMSRTRLHTSTTSTFQTVKEGYPIAYLLLFLARGKNEIKCKKKTWAHPANDQVVFYCRSDTWHGCLYWYWQRPNWERRVSVTRKHKCLLFITFFKKYFYLNPYKWRDVRCLVSLSRLIKNTVFKACKCDFTVSTGNIPDWSW